MTDTRATEISPDELLASGTAEPAPAVPVRTITPETPITTVDELAAHLHVAAQVELSTIPLYLFAAYSIRTQGNSQWAPQRGVLRTLIGISIEEMLHLALVRNIMVGIGRGHEITFYNEEFMPKYPRDMLNRFNDDDPDGPTIELALKCLSTDHIKTFRRVEQPDEINPRGETFAPGAVGQYRSLGDFYRSIQIGLDNLEKKGEKIWDLKNVHKQYCRGFWNQYGNGKPVRVWNYKSAREALEIIVEQGEGSATDHKHIEPRAGFEEYTHYEKFCRIEKGLEGIGAVNGESDISIDDDRVTWPVHPNPKIETFHQVPRIASLMRLFNACYCYTLCLLDEIYDSTTQDVVWEKFPGTERKERFSRRYALERNGIAAMQGILYPIAQALVSTPINSEFNAAPSFEFYKFGEKGLMSKKDELVLLCEEAIKYHPHLGGDDGVRRQISLLTSVD